MTAIERAAAGLPPVQAPVISGYPAATQDVALVVGETVAAADVQAALVAGAASAADGACVAAGGRQAVRRLHRRAGRRRAQVAGLHAAVQGAGPDPDRRGGGGRQGRGGRRRRGAHGRRAARRSGGGIGRLANDGRRRVVTRPAAGPTRGAVVTRGRRPAADLRRCRRDGDVAGGGGRISRISTSPVHGTWRPCRSSAPRAW